MPRMKLPISRLRPGMIIAENVYTQTGVVIIAAGTNITKEVVMMMKKYFVEHVIVDVNDTSQAASGTVVGSPRVSQQEFQAFHDNFQVAESVLSDNLKDIVYNNRDINVDNLLMATNNILERANGTTNLCDMLMMMKKSTEDLYAHCLNVSLFGQILAKWLRCTQEEIEEVAVAGMLHDLGLLKYSEDQRSDFSFRKELDGNGYDRHVLNGYNMIKNQNVSDDIKKAVLTHHERLDGSGFPMHAKNSDINKISRIIAIADIYDTLTLTEKLIEPMSPFAALKKMEELSYNKLDSGFLLTFIEHIAETFIQHHIMLNNGSIGQIIMINKYDITNPLVQINKEFIDLSRNKKLSILKILD